MGEQGRRPDGVAGQSGAGPAGAGRGGGAGRAAGSAAVLRAALLLVLLGLAAHGLSGRRDLDWSRLTQRPGAPVVAVVVLCALAVVAVAVLRGLLRMLRSAGGAGDDEALSLAPRRLSPGVYLALGLVLALLVLGVYVVVSYAAPAPTRLSNPGRLDTGSSGAGAPGRAPQALSWTAALLAAACLALLAGLRTLARRSTTASPPEPPDSTPEPAESSTPGLAQAVAAAEEGLAGAGDDVRAAIVAAYAAMEGQLALAGTVRQRSDTPTDLLLRAVAEGRVSAGPAGRLTELFREARYSSHLMPATARVDAARALTRVAQDLAGRRA